MSGFGMANGGAAVSQSIDKSTPWVAAADGNLDLLQSSLAHLGFDAGVKDENGYTILQAAASYSHLNIIEWVLTRNVNVQDVDGEGDSALHYASTPEASELLVRHGIDTQLRNSAGHTALAAKQIELNELMDDEDYEDTDPESVTLRKVIEYLSSLGSPPQ